MTPALEPIEQLAARVAELMGWRRSWIDEGGNCRSPLHYPAQVFRLMCEFRVWPVCGKEFVFVCRSDLYEYTPVDDLEIPHDNTPESRQRAATRAVLLAVEQILKEKEA